MLEDGSGKEGRQHRPWSYHRQSFESATYKTGGGYWTRSDELCKYPLLEKLHFHVALEEVRVTELLSLHLPNMMFELQCDIGL